jgi:activator of HSP90 ATPase
MSESFSVSTVLPASPQELYGAWLGSSAHAEFTHSPAEIDAQVGGKFTAWDGYISGTTLELEPPRRILQAWRTTEFPVGSPDSLIEVLFEESGDGTRLIINHTNIPDGQAEEYRLGWEDFYFTPMLEYFTS